MYTIKQVSARTGLGAPLIRAWERRYGVVQPTRTPAGYRLYDETAIRILLAMRGLLDSGWTASEAARAIVAGEIAVDALAQAGAGEVPPAAAAANRDRLIDRFISAAEATSAPDTEAAIDEILAAGSFEAVVDDILLPAAAALGTSWAAGRMSVAAEHAASAAIARRLAAAFQAGALATRTAVVVGLPPGSRHELGAMAFAVALRRRGVGVMYLGPDVPIDAWVDIVQRTRARSAVIGVVTAADRVPAMAVAEALRTVAGTIVALGGASASTPTDGAAGPIVLPSRVVEAAALVADLARRRRT